MIKAIFTALTGISEDVDSQESQDAWESRRYADEHDLDDCELEHLDDDTGDEPENVKSWLGWFGL